MEQLDGLDVAVKLALEASKKVSSYKEETYQAVLLYALLSKLEDSRGALVIPDRPAPAGKQLTVAELFTMARPATDLERVLVVGFHLEKNLEMPSFNIKDLYDAFQQVKETPPNNLNDAVNKNIRKGLLMEAGGKKGGMKSWVLTRSGESWLQGRLVESSGGEAISG